MNLTIITVSKFFDNDLINTLKSVDFQNSDLHEHIVVVSKISDKEIDILTNEFNIIYRKFIFNKDISIYNGMNIGVKASTGDYLYFLNGGDVLSSANVIFQINNYADLFPNKILIFQTLQVYKDLIFLRNPSNRLYKLANAPAHQGIVVPFNNHTIKIYLYNEFNFISADTEWMKKLLLHYHYNIIESIVCRFYLGGISNNPSLKTIKLKKNTSKYYLEIFKYLLKKIFGLKIFYILISFLNRYKRIYE